MTSKAEQIPPHTFAVQALCSCLSLWYQMEIILEQLSLVTHWLIISWPTNVFIYFVILSCEFASTFKSDGPFYCLITDHHMGYLVKEVFPTPCEYFSYIKASICSGQLVIGE